MPRISELPGASSGPLNGDEIVPIVQGGDTAFTTVAEIAGTAVGSVISVNGLDGTVVLAAADVGATPDPSTLSGVSGLDGTELVTVKQGGTDVQATTQQIADLIPVARGVGFNYTSDTASTADADPGAGFMRWNNATPTSATKLFLSDTGSDAFSLATLLNAFGGTGFLRIQQANNENRWQYWKWSLIETASGYHKLTVALMANGNAILDAHNVHLTFKDIGAPDPSTLSSVSAIGGSETLSAEQSGVPVQITVQQIVDLATGPGGTTDWDNIELISGLPSTSGLDGDEHVVVEKGSTFVQTTSLFLSQLLLGFTNVFRRNQSVNPVALTDGATINTDAALSNIFKVTLGGNRTLANPTNLTDGMILNWIIKQDGTGTRTLAYGSKFKWPSGTAPTVTATANAVSFISACYDAGNDILIANSSLGHA